MLAFGDGPLVRRLTTALLWLWLQWSGGRVYWGGATASRH